MFRNCQKDTARVASRGPRATVLQGAAHGSVGHSIPGGPYRWVLQRVRGGLPNSSRGKNVFLNQNFQFPEEMLKLCDFKLFRQTVDTPTRVARSSRQPGAPQETVLPAGGTSFVGHGIPVGPCRGVPYSVLWALSNLLEGTRNIRISFMPEVITKTEGFRK